MDVLESEHLLQARLANAVAYAAIHANPAADAEKGMANVGKLYVRALDAIPYMTVAAPAQDEKVLAAERDTAVKKWRKMRKRLEEESKADADSRTDSGANSAGASRRIRPARRDI